MMFQKPKDVSYTDMCIYIDNNVYNEDCEFDKVYEYLYHIINMLAHKNNFFKKSHYYDDFALSSASRVYMRLTNKKQFELNENSEPKLEKIRSVLNYVKDILYPMKIDFEQEHYSQLFSETVEEIDDSVHYSFVNHNEFMSIEIKDYIKNLPKQVYKYLSKIPTKRYSSEWDNIYLSCLLSLTKGLLDLYNVADNLEDSHNISDKQITRLYQKNSTVLYHLSDNAYNYVTTLTKELKNYIYRELQDIIASYEIDNSNFKQTMYSSIESLVEDEDR